MTAEELQNHLDALSDRLGCRLDQGPNKVGMMYVEFGYVEGPELEEAPYPYSFPNMESRYLVCLHELGHFRLAHTQGRPYTDEYIAKAYGIYSDEDFWVDHQYYFNNGVLRSEAQAWNYALNECIIPSEELLPETRAYMWDTCLGSYFNHAREVGFDTPGQKLYNGDRAYVEFAYGKPDAYFYQTKRRILEGDFEEDKSKEKIASGGSTEWTFVEGEARAIDWAQITSSVMASANFWNSGTVTRYTGTGS